MRKEIVTEKEVRINNSIILEAGDIIHIEESEYEGKDSFFGRANAIIVSGVSNPEDRKIINDALSNSEFRTASFAKDYQKQDYTKNGLVIVPEKKIDINKIISFIKELGFDAKPEVFRESFSLK